MKQVQLANSTTSILGLGCVSLTMHDDRRDAIRLLEEALNLGVTHFDVARKYGYGHAEGIVGDFLQGKRDRVTVTTKFGLPVPQSLSKFKSLVGVARKMARKSKLVGKLARRVNQSVTPSNAYSPADAASSLETSLRELKTDHVDVFELHEGGPSDAQRDELIAWAENEIKKGTIRAFGVGTGVHHFNLDAGQFPPVYSVLQFDSDLLTRNVETIRNVNDRTMITFGVLRPRAAIVDHAKRHPTGAIDWRARHQTDLANASHVTGLLLQHGIATNPNGITLFGTTSIDHLRANVAAVEKSAASEQELADFAQYAREMS